MSFYIKFEVEWCTSITWVDIPFQVYNSQVFSTSAQNINSETFLLMQWKMNAESFTQKFMTHDTCFWKMKDWVWVIMKEVSFQSVKPKVFIHESYRKEWVYYHESMSWLINEI